MNTNYSHPKQMLFGPNEGYEERRRRRLQHDLGVDLAAVEVILNLRSQVVALQSQIQQLESELATNEANRLMRMSRYDEISLQATWIELEFEN